MKIRKQIGTTIVEYNIPLLEYIETEFSIYVLRIRNHLLYTQPIVVLRFLYEAIVIIIRLLRKGKNHNQIKETFYRFNRYGVYNVHKKLKEKQREIAEHIVKISDKTGIPQWDIRAYLETLSKL